MRRWVGLAALCGIAAVGVAQDDPDNPPPRYGVTSAVRAYPQKSPQQAVASAVRAAEQGKAAYLVAHLLDPAFVDARVQDHARQLEVGVEKELRAVRDSQRAAAIPLPATERLPLDPAGFADAVRREAVARAFRVVVRDVAGFLADNPDHVRDLRRFVRDGQFIDAGETATATIPGLPDRQVSARKVGVRWFVDDRRTPAAENPPAKGAAP